MGKDLFLFQKFELHQKQGFRVTTEACIFGAFLAQNYPAQNVLDIGTGTGLLSLMYAQKNQSATITALEIDKNAAEQAFQNFEKCSFGNFSLFCADALEWAKVTENTFDLIFSNPPFFSNHLLGDNKYQNTAKHQTTLTLEDLAIVATKLLSPNGQIAILLPVYEQELMAKNMAALGFKNTFVLNVYSNETSKQIRTIAIYKNRGELGIEELFIYNQDRRYTTNFTELLKSYYTIFENKNQE